MSLLAEAIDHLKGNYVPHTLSQGGFLGGTGKAPIVGLEGQFQ